MKTKLFLISFIGTASFMFAQTTTTLSVRVNSSLDDHEERINGSVPQSGTLGSMDAASSDLELGNESATSDPQLIGIRFNNLTIPANAIIVNAYIQFAVDGTAKNTDPCVLNIKTEDNENPATFADTDFSLTSRNLTNASVTWTVSGSTWNTVGSAGIDQRTADLKTLVQAMVDKPSWTSGNSMAFFIQGNGTREVESYDGDIQKAPELVVQYTAGTNGINELQKSSFTKLYPNPFKNFTSINVEISTVSDVTISIYDITGNLIEEFTKENSAVGSLNYKSSTQLSSGLYIVKVKANNKQESLKLISE